MRHIKLILFTFLASLYFLTMAGHPTTSMGVSAVLTATSVIDEGNFSLEEPTLETGIGVDGKYYPYEGLAFILVVSFFAALSKMFGTVPNGIFFTNHILTSIACIILFLIGRELKYSIKTSILLALIYGVGTMAWVHSRYLMPEPLTTVVYLAAFLFLLKYRRVRHVTWLLSCGFFTGCALIVRPDAPLFIIVIVSGIIVLFYNDYRDGKKTLTILLRDGLIFLSPLFFFFAIYAYYNYARFGDILELGYATKAQEIPESRRGYGEIRIHSLADTL
ncbi:MAG: phospholipid carrier-dependent glycosyltransferase [Gemmatimonadota bacterium]|nr:MAG: phospholipid carrier-dependent glycosyltransferase [Gemmatimonadota bacterium]